MRFRLNFVLMVIFSRIEKIDNGKFTTCLVHCSCEDYLSARGSSEGLEQGGELLYGRNLMPVR